MAIKRVNYFNGQFLRERDFNDEQAYHLTMRRTHNLRAHAPGILHGLDVVAGTGQVTVKAGMAIDPDGREVVLEADTPLAVAAAAPGSYVVLALNEQKSDKAVAPDPILVETRWTEGPVLAVAATLPPAGVALAQIASVAANGVVSLNAGYRRLYSSPSVGGDLTVGRDLTVNGNLEVKGQTTLVQTDLMRGNVQLGDEDADTVTLRGRLVTGHSSGLLQVGSPAAISGALSVLSTPTSKGLTVQGNTVLGSADGESVTVRGTLVTGHSSTRLKVTSPLDVTGDILVSGLVDGRDVLADGNKLDTHAANTANPHATTAAQIDTQGGGVNQIVARINAGTGTIDEARIHATLAREARFHTATGHDHDGANSRKIAPNNLLGVGATVTAAALNALTGGPNSNASQYHTHPFVPGAGSVTLDKLEERVRARVLKVPALVQSLFPTQTLHVYGAAGGSAFDGTHLWVNVSLFGTLGFALKIDPATNVVVATIPVGSMPVAVAFGGGAVWVANQGSHTVSRIDPATNAVTASVSVGFSPSALAVDGSFLWVANASSNSVSKLDTATNAVVATVPVGNGPFSLTVAGTFVWVACNSSHTVSKINTATNTVAATVAVSSPWAIAASGATFVWVSSHSNKTLVKIDAGANTVAATVPLPTTTNSLVVTGNFVWANHATQLHKVDTTTNAVVATVVHALNTSHVGNALVAMPGFIVGVGSTSVWKLDATANTLSATLPLLDVKGMVFDGQKMWLAIHGTRQVLKVDVNSMQLDAAVTVGDRPHSLAFNGSHVFVSNFGSNTVSKIDVQSAAVVATIPVGANPAGIAFSPTYRTVWVANSGDNTASVFSENATSVSGTMPVGTKPQGLVCESSFVWVTNTGSNNVMRLGAWGAGNPSGTYNLGLAPHAILFDFNHLWVINAGGNTLNKLPANSATPVAVALPAGVVPVRMCFEGQYVIVHATNQQLYRIDAQTNNVVTLPFNLGTATEGVLGYDGIYLWCVEARNGWIFRAAL